MASEDTYNGAKNAFTFHGAYFNAVAQEVGSNQAIALWTKMCETIGAMQGKVMKEQGGIEGTDASAVWSVVKAVPEGLGIDLEQLEESPKRVRFNCRRCSVHEGWKTAGLDDKTRETMCRAGSVRVMDAAVKQINPNLSYELVRYRSATDDSCEEQLVLGG